MNISSAGSASGQSSLSASNNLKTLEAKQQKIENEIKQLQKRGTEENAAAIKQLQQQLSQIEQQITEQQSSAASQGLSASVSAGSAYSVELSGQSVPPMNTTAVKTADYE